MATLKGSKPDCDVPEYVGSLIMMLFIRNVLPGMPGEPYCVPTPDGTRFAPFRHNNSRPALAVPRKVRKVQRYRNDDSEPVRLDRPCVTN